MGLRVRLGPRATKVTEDWWVVQDTKFWTKHRPVPWATPLPKKRFSCSRVNQEHLDPLDLLDPKVNRGCQDMMECKVDQVIQETKVSLACLEIQG